MMKGWREENSLWMALLAFCFSLQFVDCQQQNQLVYGVRWSLGDRFKYYRPPTEEGEKSQNYYILSFNSDELFEADVLVNIKDSTYTCSGRKLFVDMSDYENGLTEED